MRKLVFLAVIGIAATTLTLAAPTESRADDHRRRSNFSIGVGNGGFQLDYSRGGYGQGRYYAPGYGYGNYYAPGYGAYYSPRPVIVQPSELHWTPHRGWHEHGQILVPHRGHYHVRPY